MRKLPPNSVRGQVRAWIERHADRLGDDVLEVGSRLHTPEAWWIVNRDLAVGRWTGMDMQPGPNVDVVTDLHDLPAEWRGRFSGVVCSEVLEHVANPWAALVNLRKVMRPGAIIIVTVPFCFPEHAFPDDYWRFTVSGLREVLNSAGFVGIETERGPVTTPFALNDHGERGTTRRNEPLHTFGIARCPEDPCSNC